MLSIIKKVITINIRNNKFVLFNALFPIFLMIMIGGMLKNEFVTSKSLDDINITYYNEGNEQSNLILNVMKNNDLGMDINIKEVKSIDEGKQSARLNKSVFIHLNKKDIDIYANDNSQINNYAVNSILKSINKQIHLNNVLINNNLNSNINHNEDNANKTYENVTIEKLPARQSMSSFDYYGIVHITMITMYVGLFPIYGMRSERDYKLKDRINLAGISSKKYYLGNFIGYIVLGGICITPGYLFAMLVLNINLGQNPLLPYLLMITLVMTFISICMFIECIFKDSDKAAGVLQGIVLPVMSFLGGCYMSLPDNVGGIFQLMTHLSPLRWANRAIFRLNLGGDYSMYIFSMAINLAICLIFIIGIMVVSKREEKLS